MTKGKGRLISFALTPDQIVAMLKDVTRRNRWKKLKAGDRLQPVDRVMGFKLGEHPNLLLPDGWFIRVVSTHWERLDAITEDDVRREGFPGKSPEWFINFYCAHNGGNGSQQVNRIEFKYEQEGKMETPDTTAEPSGAAEYQGLKTLDTNVLKDLGIIGQPTYNELKAENVRFRAELDAANQRATAWKQAAKSHRHNEHCWHEWFITAGNLFIEQRIQTARVQDRYNNLWKAFEKLVRQFGKLGSAVSDVYDLEFETDYSTSLRYLRRVMKVTGVTFFRKQESGVKP